MDNDGEHQPAVAWLTRLPCPVHTLLCQYLNVPSLLALR